MECSSAQKCLPGSQAAAPPTSLMVTISGLGWRLTCSALLTHAITSAVLLSHEAQGSAGVCLRALSPWLDAAGTAVGQLFLSLIFINNSRPALSTRQEMGISCSSDLQFCIYALERQLNCDPGFHVQNPMFVFVFCHSQLNLLNNFMRLFTLCVCV